MLCCEVVRLTDEQTRRKGGFGFGFVPAVERREKEGYSDDLQGLLQRQVGSVSGIGPYAAGQTLGLAIEAQLQCILV